MKDKKTIPVSDIVRISVMCALTVVCSWINVAIVPSVPFTLQVFAIFFSLEFIGGRNGTISFAVYLALGAAGVPVFSHFGGGIGHIAGPTGGYLVGFVVTCVLYWIAEKKIKASKVFHYIMLALCLLACYAVGTVWFILYMHKSVYDALALCVVPFIIPDIIKIALAVFLSDRLRKILKI
ncbi:MAG: biotin transporter BioY [Clostridia bacterium]|nr:biotin transporter BioY [Clostridia bacterium]